MSYKYYNMFQLTDELAESISAIISQSEGTQFICKQLIVPIPKRMGLVFHSPLDGYNPWGGGLKALSGAQIQAINEEYGEYKIGVLPAEEYSFLVVMDSKSLEAFSNHTFKSKEDIERALESLGAFYIKYDGIFDSSTLMDKYPCLQEFFDRLDIWRAETGRVTLNAEILASSTSEALTNNGQKEGR